MHVFALEGRHDALAGGVIQAPSRGGPCSAPGPKSRSVWPKSVDRYCAPRSEWWIVPVGLSRRVVAMPTVSTTRAASGRSRIDQPDDPPAPGVDHQGHVEPALPRRYVGDVGPPHLVGAAGRSKAPADQIGGHRLSRLAGWSSDAVTAGDALPAELAQQARHPPSARRDAELAQLHVDAGCAVGLVALVVDLRDLRRQRQIRHAPRRRLTAAARRSSRCGRRAASGTSEPPSGWPAQRRRSRRSSRPGRLRRLRREEGRGFFQDLRAPHARSGSPARAAAAAPRSSTGQRTAWRRARRPRSICACRPPVPERLRRDPQLARQLVRRAITSLQQPQRLLAELGRVRRSGLRHEHPFRRQRPQWSGVHETEATPTTVRDPTSRRARPQVRNVPWRRITDRAG